MSESVFNAASFKIKATRRAVDAAIAAHMPGRRERYWFSEPSGMYLQITPAGTASYCLRYVKPGGGKGDYTIGQAAKITPEMAKEAATAKVAALTLHGVDPCEARRRTRRDVQERKQKTFRALADAFMAAPENCKLATRTVKERQWQLDKYILPRMGDRPLDTLRRGDVKDCLRAIHASVQGGTDAEKTGNRTATFAHGIIKRVFTWAIEEERCETNPALFKKMFDDTPTKRIGALNDDRAGVILRALSEEAAKGWGNATAIAIQLCFLTLQRPNEVVSAHRDDFDWKARIWRIPESRTKTNTLYEIPLTDDAAALFREAFALTNSPWAFPAKDGKRNLQPNALSHRFDKTRRRLVKAGVLPKDVQLYDARRFGRTRLVQALGVPEHIAERVINHSPDRRMAGRYDVADYSAEIRRAHETWALELRRIVSGASLVVGYSTQPSLPPHVGAVPDALGIAAE